MKSGVVGRVQLLRRVSRGLLVVYVGMAVLFLVADAWAYFRSLRPPDNSVWEIDENPPPRSCAYTLEAEQGQPSGTRYSQVWKVDCTFDRSKGYRPDDYPIYYDLIIADSPAKSATARFLPIGSLAVRALAPIRAAWQGGELHVATWPGGLMDLASQIGDIRVVVDRKGRA